MAIYGYARVSTGEQNVAAQRVALVGAGVPADAIEEETASGTVPARKRVRLAMLLDKTARGDMLVVAKLDRLGRSASDTMAVISDLERKGVAVRLLDLGADTTTAAGCLVLGVLASVCEWEHGVLVERTKAGIEAARRAGRLPGRRHRLTSPEREEVRRLRIEGRSNVSVR